MTKPEDEDRISMNGKMMLRPCQIAITEGKGTIEWCRKITFQLYSY